MMIVACSAVVLAIVAIVFTNLPSSPYPWIFLITFFSLVLIVGILYKKMEADRLNRENSTKNNKQTVIRAIGEQLELQMHACLQVKNKSTNTTCEEIQQIIINIEQGWAQLHLQYERCIHAVQTSMDETLFEQAKSDFFSHAITNQERLNGYAKEINQLDAFLRQQNFIRMFIQKYEPLMKKIQNMLEYCTLPIWTAKLSALKSELENFFSHTVSRVENTHEEIEKLQIWPDVEVSLKDFGMKIQECERTIEQKESKLKNIRECEQKKLIRMLNQESEPLMKNIQNLLDNHTLSIWTAKLSALKSELEKFISKIASSVDKTNEEIEQLKIKFYIEDSLKDFGKKIQECQQMIEQKDDTKKKIREYVTKNYENYLVVLDRLTKNLREDSLEDGNLKCEVDLLKTETETGYQCKYPSTLKKNAIFN